MTGISQADREQLEFFQNNQLYPQAWGLILNNYGDQLEPGARAWFTAAGDANIGVGAINDYLRFYTQFSSWLDGVTLTETQLQTISDDIAFRVLDEFLDTGIGLTAQLIINEEAAAVVNDFQLNNENFAGTLLGNEMLGVDTRGLFIQEGEWPKVIGSGVASIVYAGLNQFIDALDFVFTGDDTQGVENFLEAIANGNFSVQRPDGSAILLERNGSLRIFSSTGAELFSGSWQPVGSGVAFQVLTEEGHKLFVQKTEGVISGGVEIDSFGFGETQFRVAVDPQLGQASVSLQDIAADGSSSLIQEVLLSGDRINQALAVQNESNGFYQRLADGSIAYNGVAIDPSAPEAPALEVDIVAKPGVFLLPPLELGTLDLDLDFSVKLDGVEVSANTKKAMLGGFVPMLRATNAAFTTTGGSNGLAGMFAFGHKRRTDGFTEFTLTDQRPKDGLVDIAGAFGLNSPFANSRVEADSFGRKVIIEFDANGAHTKTTIDDDDLAIEKRYDANGDLIDTRVIVDDALITSQQIGSIFGSVLGRHLGGDDPLAQIALSTVLGTAAFNLGEILDVALFDGGTNTSGNIGDALRDFPNEIAATGVGAISSYLIGELFSELGVGGIPGDVLQTGVGHTVSTIASNITAGGPDAAFNGLGNANFANVFGTFTGSLLANEVVSFDSIGGQLGASIGSSIAPIIAASLLNPATAIGTFGLSAAAAFTAGWTITLARAVEAAAANDNAAGPQRLAA